MANCDNIPTLETVQNFNTDAKVLTEVVTSTELETVQQDSVGNTHITLEGLERRVNDAVGNVTGENIGEYSTNPTYTNYNQYVTYDRAGEIERWYLNEDVPLDYLVDSVTYPDPVDDNNLHPSNDRATILQAIARDNGVNDSNVAYLTTGAVSGVSYFYDSVTQVAYYSPVAITGDLTELGTDIDGVRTITVDGSPYVIRKIKTDRKKRSVVSFVFDDAHESALTDVKTLFDSREYKFAVAIPYGSIGNPGRLSLADIQTLNNEGIEIINHNVSGDVANNPNYGVSKMRAEVRTCDSALRGIGVVPVGFQAPSSIALDEYLDEISAVCPFAFTTATSNSSVIKYGHDPLKLFRFSIEAASVSECEDIIDLVSEEGGAVVFYAHDIVTGDTNYDNIVAIMDKVEISNGVEILPVSQSISEITGVNAVRNNWYNGTLISNDPNGFSVLGDSTISVGNVSDLTITAVTANTTLVQKTINLPDSIGIGDLITFSGAFRRISGTFGTGNSIGIQLKDSGNNILSQREISGGTLNTVYPRYNVSIPNVANAVKATVFFRADAESDGAESLIRNPVLTTGSNINPAPFVAGSGNSSNILTLASFPAQTLAGVTPTTNQIEFTPESDNGLYSVSSGSITFTRDATICIKLSIFTGQTSSATTWEYGWMGVRKTGGSVLSQNPIVKGNSTYIAEVTLTISVSSGDSLVFDAFVNGRDLTLNTSNSRCSVVEIN